MFLTTITLDFFICFFPIFHMQFSRLSRSTQAARFSAFFAILLLSVSTLHAASSVSSSSSSSSASTQSSAPSKAANDPSIRIEKVGIDGTPVPVTGDFSVSPTRLIQKALPGETIKSTISVFNRQGKTVTYELHRQDFAPDAQTDDINLFKDKDGPFSSRSWFTTVKEFTVSHGERAFVPVTITIPKNASVGDHYTALMIQEKELPGGAGINIVSQVGILFLITADGNTVKEGMLEKFFATLPIYWSRIATFGVKYKNTGTVHLAPEGMIRVQNIFGVTVDQIPFRDWYIYRGSFRTREITWSPRFALGRYTANIELKDAAHLNEPITASVSFWILPIIPLLIVLGTVFLLSLLVQIILSRFEIRKKDEKEKQEKKDE
jgi:hypothetical protein